MTAAPSHGPTWPDDCPDVIPLMPLVLSIWRDGVLSPSELAALRGHVDAQEDFSEAGRAAIKAWMDPDAPPTPEALRAVQQRIRAAVDPAAHTGSADSLAALGLAAWTSVGGDGPWEDPVAIGRLHELEATLGVLGGEAARRMLGVPTDIGTEPAAGSLVDIVLLQDFLEKDHRKLRERALKLVRANRTTIARGLPHAEYREQVLGAVQRLADEGLGRLAYPVEYGGSADPAASVAVFETLAFGDLSVLVKFGVQFGLFGGSVHQLGTRRHHEAYLQRIGSAALPGCYAMTETGHGSNVRDLETTATYDHATRELVVDTPHEGAGKDYIGNAAVHGQLATVFSRLIVDGEDHGVHAVLVPIRSFEGNAWMAYAFNHHISGSAGVRWQSWDHLSGADPGLNLAEDPGNVGAMLAGQRAMLPIGLNFLIPDGSRFAGNRLSVEAVYSMHHDYEGPQLGLDWGLNVGWTIGF
ncbi:MAG: acyl-CoA dehydrogenase family protein [Gemmatimonadetes bacterium]|nr:acyl-CoA dehydrogenase family protein [Gemmatimonadota bacterium]MDA1103541.1 acyl-CoA dehydrogenase family protein [Gemmatimonadota bacterium]